MTVNRALRELTDAGVVTRVQGVGSFVAAPKAESAMFAVRSIRDEIQARGQSHKVQVLICEPVSARSTTARQFGLPAAHELFHSRLLHLRSEEHTSELQSLMRTSYAAFCLKK